MTAKVLATMNAPGRAALVVLGLAGLGGTAAAPAPRRILFIDNSVRRPSIGI